jgi:hypothetical protein
MRSRCRSWSCYERRSPCSRSPVRAVRYEFAQPVARGADQHPMGGVDATSGTRTSRWDDLYDDPACKASACHGSSARAPAAAAPWASDGAHVPEAVRSYDPAMFSNPALRGPPAAAPVAAQAPAVASAPDPLPAAADAYHGIRLACIAGDLPPMSRTDAASIVRVGAYTLQPAVRIQQDGSKSLLYWTAVNRDAKRAEFIIGPEALDTFRKNVSSYENAGATAYMNGEPNEWQRLSMKAVDDAMRSGPTAALGTLKSAWSAAVRDPSWWGQNVLAITGAMAGAGAHTPLVEGEGCRRTRAGCRTRI